MEREVTLSEVLAAREDRVARQAELLAAYGAPLISFTMNIAGPVKDTALIRRAFFAGCAMLETELERAELPVRERREKLAHTGCEAYYAVNGDPLAVKRVCTAVEDSCPLGRLFDMDVIGVDGEKLDRAAVGGGERSCLVCGAPGRGCASRRVHSVAELQNATTRLITDHFAAADGEEVSFWASAALSREVVTTPKPGLVDRANNGSHRDMDIDTFRASIEALAPYWKECFDLGRKTAQDAPAETFRKLREAGLRAEQTMLAATAGVNTHKGAIFTLGAVCGAIGRLWTAEAPCRDPERIARECAAMTKDAVAADWAAMKDLPAEKLTAGQRLYRQFGLAGIRGEVAAGLPGVTDVVLPALRRALAAGKSLNDAGAIALLHLIARGTDTNMVHRGGMALAREAAEKVRDLLSRNPMPDMAEIAALDRWFIENNLSPGGCADLLGVTYFLHDWESAEK